MARTDATTVQSLLLKDYDTENAPSLTPFINAAYSLMNKVVTCAALKGITLSDEDLALIEGWLAAHFYTANDPQYTSKSTAGASASFGWQLGKSLEGSRYGQMALLLDTSGCLNQIMKRAKATFAWAGKAPSAQTPYDQRD